MHLLEIRKIFANSVSAGLSILEYSPKTQSVTNEFHELLNMTNFLIKSIKKFVSKLSKNAAKNKEHNRKRAQRFKQEYTEERVAISFKN
ncbi:hypothetical protein [Candidatus Bealeia paramacronuclearis]|uniref:hypothetical protein n=1 Tax=Candidatus Bealeia paramacronuclearis TaxID=1921001 RepID=UPI002F25F5D7